MSVRAAMASATRYCSTEEPARRSSCTSAIDDRPARRWVTRARSRVRKPWPSCALAEYPAFGMPGGGVISASAAPASTPSIAGSSAGGRTRTPKRLRPRSRSTNGASGVGPSPGPPAGSTAGTLREDGRGARLPDGQGSSRVDRPRTSPSSRTRSWWGWGWEDQALDDAACRSYGALLPGLPPDPLPVPRVAELDLPAPRVAAPAALAAFTTDDPHERAGHAQGKAYRDVVRALHRRLATPPDLVARPTDEPQVVAVLDWAADAGVAVVPYGGGSSVVGGVEYDGADHAGVVSLDLTAMDRVLEVDPVSRAARIQAGALGPVL